MRSWLLRVALIAALAAAPGASGTRTEADTGFGTLPEERLPAVPECSWRLLGVTEPWAFWAYECGGVAVSGQMVELPRPEPVLIVPWRSPRNIVAAVFPEYPQWAWSVTWCESGQSWDTFEALLWLKDTGAAGELTPWQIMPGNFRVIGEWPIPGDFEQQTRLARKWHDLIGNFASRGGWSCA